MRPGREGGEHRVSDEQVTTGNKRTLTPWGMTYNGIRIISPGDKGAVLDIFIFIFCYFWLHHMACGISVPQPGIEPVLLAMKVRSLNHWTAGEFPLFSI